MIDPAKLAAWREKFTNDKPHQTEGEAFRTAAGLAFKSGGVRKLPYSGVPTLIGAPYRPDGDLAGLDVALVGVPMDLAVTNRAGCRLGPRAIRNVERIGPFHHTHNIAPLAELEAADVGDVPFRSRFSLEESHQDIEAFFTKVVAAGVKRRTDATRGTSSGNCLWTWAPRGLRWHLAAQTRAGWTASTAK